MTIKIPVKEDPIKTIDVFSSYELAVDRNTFIVTAPMQGMLLYPIHPNESVLITYLSDSAVFEAPAISGERLKRGDLNYLIMKCDGYVVRNQRRADFRLDITIETELLMAMDTNPSMVQPGQTPTKCVIHNLSAGGAAVMSNIRPEIGDPIHINLPPEIFGEKMTLMAQVHWVRNMEDPESVYKYNMGIRFLFGYPTDKEMLRKFVWETQRLQLRRNK